MFHAVECSTPPTSRAGSIAQARRGRMRTTKGTIMAMLPPGDPAPYFHAEALGGNPRYAFDTAAGRPVLLLFLGSAAWPHSAQAPATIERYRTLFDDVRANVVGVSIDPADVALGRIAPDLPALRWFVAGAAEPLPSAADPEGLSVRSDPGRALDDRLLRSRCGGRRRTLPRASRRHHQGHRAPQVRVHNQPECLGV